MENNYTVINFLADKEDPLKRWMDRVTAEKGMQLSHEIDAMMVESFDKIGLKGKILRWAYDGRHIFIGRIIAKAIKLAVIQWNNPATMNSSYGISIGDKIVIKKEFSNL